MAVTCPYCQNTLSFQKHLKPGKYAPACPKCSRKVQVIIPDDPTKQPTVRAIQAEREKWVTAPGPTGQSQVQANLPSLKKLKEDGETAPQTGVKPGAKQPQTIPETVDLSANQATVETRSARGDAPRPPIDSNMPTPIAPSPQVEASESAPGAIPASLGGYQVLKELGRGGMGAVYLARQLSLNRSVALKVMKPQWARNATFVARFTREAYAAAQLTHHNVVQIYDFGEDKGTTYFSMEFVDGETLAGLLRNKKRLDPEEAAGYILQAARGLKFAHDQSMIHRDVKPDNLLLNRQGIVKVADLGLVKTPEIAEAEQTGTTSESPAPPSAADWPSVAGSSQITMAHSAMGTPAYMAPEQAQDAARVDPRADIYSLGCTLYAMVTGRPPFDGRTAVEILSKHQFEPMTPPEVVAKRVPKSLSDIVLKMTAKKPEDRYPELGGVIRDLEAFLGISSAGPFTPREEHANLVEQAVAQFNASPAARLRKQALPAIIVLCLVFSIGSALFGRFVVAGGFLGLGLTTVLVDFMIGGIRRKSFVFQKVRELVFGSSIVDWLFVSASLVLLVALIYALGLFWVCLAVTVVGSLLALLVGTALDRRAEAERQAPIEQIEKLLKTLRLNGLNEESIRQFICKYSGQNWEECYEALFGYEAKLQARERWGRGDGARARPQFATWRDPLISWIETKLQTRREAKEVAKLQKIEERSLQSQGENLVTARRKAKRAAEAMVVTAGEIKETIRRGTPTGSSSRKVVKTMAEAASKPEAVLAGLELELDGNRSGGLLTALVGPRVRFLSGAVLLAGCLTWMHQNGVISTKQGQALIDVAKTGDVQAIQARAEAELARTRQRDAKTVKQNLKLPVVPDSLLGLVSSYGAGVAGLILIFSSLFQGARIAIFALPAATIPILAPRGLPQIGWLDPSLAPSIIGAAIMGVGILLVGRGRT